MFMIVSYPWPVASAYAQPFGTGRQARERKQQGQDQPATEPEQQGRILISSKV